jgi:glycosyltransferase involved in cell wall biosynthesis
MKILFINNHHNMNGGAERYYFDLSRFLISKGHEIAYFSMLDIHNKETKWKKYFVDNINFEKGGLNNTLYKLQRIFYSLEAKKKIAILLDAFKPDIVHINNIYFYISPSILGVIKKRNIPIIQTVHDYQLISPNVTLFYNGKICEVTKKHKYYKAFFHRSIKGRYIASFMATIASYVQYIFKFYKRNVDLFITPSHFMKNKLVEYGFEAKKIIQLNNFVNSSGRSHKVNNGKYVLYFGRLNEAKGILILLEAARQLPEVKFKIAGNFEDEGIKNKVLEKIKREKIGNVDFQGFVTGRALTNLIGNSCFCVVPSLWYENQPYSVLESFAQGKTVVASRIGGIPEIVKNNDNGLLFRPGDSGDLTEKIQQLWNNPKLIERLREGSLKTIKEKFNPKAHYKKILAVYQKVISKRL